MFLVSSMVDLILLLGYLRPHKSFHRLQYLVHWLRFSYVRVYHFSPELVQVMLYVEIVDHNNRDVFSVILTDLFVRQIFFVSFDCPENLFCHRSQISSLLLTGSRRKVNQCMEKESSKRSNKLHSLGDSKPKMIIQ